MSLVPDTLEQVFRKEYGRIIATLIRISGSFDLAEEALQEAFVSAAANWARDGAPLNPGAWLTTVAQRKLLDTFRREKTRTDKQGDLEYELQRTTPEQTDVLDESEPYSDDRLRLIFTCCHPALSREAQVALTLRTLGGLTTLEIARAFLLPEATLAQRLVRAKNKIRVTQIPYSIPTHDVLAERLASVQAVIYLIFSEGYSATAGEGLIRKDLCAESIRLCRLLCELIMNDAESIGLLSLMLLQDSRREARIDREGNLVTLDQQDRSHWDQLEIEEGLELVERALKLRRPGPYQLQAAIAALHSEAKSAHETDWRQIVALYRELMRMSSSPVISLNHAVAVAMSEGIEQGLALVDRLGDVVELKNYYPYHAARADLLRRLNRFEDAVEAYQQALKLASNRVDRHFIQRRLQECEGEEIM